MACRASPEFVKAAKGVIMLDMLCNHQLYGDLIDDIGVHVHSVKVAEGLWPSCEMDMPGWGDE